LRRTAVQSFKGGPRMQGSSSLASAIALGSHGRPNFFEQVASEC
jgi:hypothetical protein